MPDRNQDPNLYSRQPDSLVMYSVDWCGDCRRTKRFLAQNNVRYIDVNIDHDKKAEAFVKEVNKGNRSVPTLVFPDGSIMVEPSNPQLSDKFK